MKLVNDLVKPNEPGKNLSEEERKQCVLAQKNLWTYCKLTDPKFFKDHRYHLKQISDAFQALYEGRIIKFKPTDKWQIVDTLEGLPEHITCKKMMLNEPPRHGKSYSATKAVQWMFGDNDENRVITGSYNEKLSSRFGKAVRNGIEATRRDNKRVVFSDVFPGVKVTYGDASSTMWSLEGQHFSYLATSFNGTVTGVGCNIGIIDDQIKLSSEANNQSLLESHWDWYTNTFLSRLEENAIQIIIMTRWSTKDLCGRLLALESDEWYELKLKALLNEETHEMLCPDLLSYENYKDKTKPGKMSPEIALANYQQEPIDAKGKLYTSFKTYLDLPRDSNGRLLYDEIISYTDTADMGSDWLMNICGLSYKGEGFVTDVYYTKDGMEITEPETARRIHENGVTRAEIESNNGGRGFARNVERILWEKYRTRKVKVKWFHQSENKIARILSNSSFVMEHIYFPWNWAERWPEYYRDMNSYQRGGKNAHDDAPDGTTGFSEMIQDQSSKGAFDQNALNIFKGIKIWH